MNTHGPKRLSTLLSDLNKRKVTFSLSGDALKYSDPLGNLRDDEKNILRDRKEEIKTYLRALAAAIPTPIQKRALLSSVPSLTQDMWWRWVAGLNGAECDQRVSGASCFHNTEQDKVRGAVRQLPRRHDALLYSFSHDGSTLAATYNDPDSFEIEGNDLSALSFDAARARLEEIKTEFFTREIPADSKWLILAKVVAMPSRDTIVMFSINHLIADGQSLALLFEDLDKILKQGEAAPVPPLRFADYAVWERDWVGSAAGSTLIGYWREWMENQPSLLIPGTQIPLHWQPGRRSTWSFTLPASVADAIFTLTAANSTTPFKVFLALFGTAVTRWADTDRTAIRCISQARTTQELSQTVGMMSCHDPLDFRAARDEEFSSVLHANSTEHQSAMSRRMPNLLRFPPHSDWPGIEECEFSNRIPATLNYVPMLRSLPKTKNGSVAGDQGSPPWPPALTHGVMGFRPRATCPIYLLVQEQAEDIAGVFLFNDGVLNLAHQESLMAEFFAQMAKAIL